MESTSLKWLPFSLCNSTMYWHLKIADLAACVRQKCQLALRRATTTTFPRSSFMGVLPSISHCGAGLQILEPVLSFSTNSDEAPSRAGRADSNSGQRACITSAGLQPLQTQQTYCYSWNTDANYHQNLMLHTPVELPLCLHRNEESWLVYANKGLILDKPSPSTNTTNQ